MSEITNITSQSDLIPVSKYRDPLIPIRHIGWLSLGVWSLVFLALVYGSIQIWQMSGFLHAHSAYVHSRDAEWTPLLERLHEYLAENRQQNEQILRNQKAILERLK